MARLGDKLKQKAMAKVADMLGIDPDASLPELIEFANENFDAGIVVENQPISEAVAFEELTRIGRDAHRCIEAVRSGATGVQFLRVTAAPTGKSRIVAFVIVEKPAKSS